MRISDWSSNVCSSDLRSVDNENADIEARQSIERACLHERRSGKALAEVQSALEVRQQDLDLLTVGIGIVSCFARAMDAEHTHAVASGGAYRTHHVVDSELAQPILIEAGPRGLGRSERKSTSPIYS